MTRGMNSRKPLFTKFHLQHCSIITNIQLLFIVHPHLLGNGTIDKHMIDSFGAMSKTRRTFRGKMNTSFSNTIING
ncbi:hypothetical protein LguiA_014558 [Lonicera macranthoides]